MLKIAALSVVISVVIAGPVVDWVAIKPASTIREVQASDADKQVIQGASDDVKQKWNDFKSKHGKWYETVEEETRRFWTFLKNLHKVEEHNKLYEMKQRTYTLGINRYADMSPVEFSHYYLGLKRDYNNTKATDRSTYLSPFHLSVPDTVDWREKGLVTAVKNQGQCGSCWSFSTTGSLEGQHAKKTGKLISLSEQQLVDCSEKYGNHGCEGGLMDQAFQYIEDVGGIESEAEYPYKAKDHRRCRFDVSKEVATVTGFKDVPEQDENALKEAVASVGPVSVAIDAGHQDFQLYRDGVYSNPRCSSTQLDHGVLVVGYGSEDGQDYWLIKNSWGEEWGLSGYIKIARNENNMCGVATTASYPLV